MSIKLPIPHERLSSKSISDKFWGCEPKQNYFARAKNIVTTGNLDRKMLLQVQSEYDGDLATDFADQWRELLKEITFQIAIDGVIDPEEQAFFKEYIAIFRIPKDEASRIYRSGARSACLMLLSDVYEDGIVEDHEIEHVERIAKGFGLKEFDAKANLTAQLKKLVQARFNEMISDLMISDHEWEQFQKYTRNLRVELTTDSKTDEVVRQARLNWRRKYGKLEPIDVDGIKISKNELAYFEAIAHWIEDRKRNGEAYQKIIATGRIVLTSKRLMLIASSGDNKSINWDSVHQVVNHGAAIFELEKISGKSPTIHVIDAEDIGWLTATIVAQRLCNGQLE